MPLYEKWNSIYKPDESGLPPFEDGKEKKNVMLRLKITGKGI